MTMTATAAVAVALFFAAGAAAWTWPADGLVARPFLYDPDNPEAPGQHRGIDVAATAAAVVRAPAAGEVTFAGSVAANGLSITIRTSDGYAVTLTHLGTIGARKGAILAEGDAVGVVGPSGAAEVDGPYVHLGVRSLAEPDGYLDPVAFLPPRLAAPSSPPAGPVAGAAVQSSAVAQPPVAAIPVEAPPVPALAAAPAPVEAAAPAAASPPASPSQAVAEEAASTAVEASPLAETVVLPAEIAPAAPSAVAALPGRTEAATTTVASAAQPTTAVAAEPRIAAGPPIPVGLRTSAVAGVRGPAPVRAEGRFAAAPERLPRGLDVPTFAPSAAAQSPAVRAGSRSPSPDAALAEIPTASAYEPNLAPAPGHGTSSGRPHGPVSVAEARDSQWRALDRLVVLALAAAAAAAGLVRTRIMARGAVLPDHAHLLRQRRTAHRPRVHDDAGRRPGAPSPAAR